MEQNRKSRTCQGILLSVAEGKPSKRALPLCRCLETWHGQHENEQVLVAHSYTSLYTTNDGDGLRLLAPTVSLDPVHDGPEDGARFGFSGPARPHNVCYVGRGIGRNIRTKAIKRYTNVNFIGVCHARPRKLSRKNLPHHDAETVDVAGVCSSGGV